MTEIHDSTTCKLGANGGACEICRFAGEIEKSRSKSPSEPSEPLAAPAGFLASEAKNVSSSPQTLRMGIPASTATIRAALFDTLDENTRELYAHDCEYHRVTDEEASENRYLLADMLIRRIGEIQKLHAKERGK